jgi:hypothetical protein
MDPRHLVMRSAARRFVHSYSFTKREFVLAVVFIHTTCSRERHVSSNGDNLFEVASADAKMASSQVFGFPRPSFDEARACFSLSSHPCSSADTEQASGLLQRAYDTDFAVVFFKAKHVVSSLILTPPSPAREYIDRHVLASLDMTRPPHDELQPAEQSCYDVCGIV